MIKIFVYSATKKQAERAVQTLKSSGAEQVELLESLKLSKRQPKEHHHLFICETPAEKLTTLAPLVLPENEYAKELSVWYAAASATIATCNAQKRRSILISNSLLNSPNTLIELINEQWALNLESNSGSVAQETITQNGQLLAYLVQNLVNQTPELISLADDITKLSGIECETIDETDALTAYRGVKQTIKQLNSDKQALLDANADLKSQLKNSTEEAELLLTHLHTVQEELERNLLEGKTNQETTEKEKTELASFIERTQASNRNLQEESAQLLLQIHQVQEELERNFLELKEAKASKQQTQIRWKRIFKNNPEIFDYDCIDLKQLDGETNSFKWVVEGLEGASISRNRVAFETFVENGVIGIRFHKEQPHKGSSLIKWPDSVKEDSIVDIIPAGNANNKVLRAKTLKELSTSDWNLVNTLPLIMLKELPVEAKLEEPITKFKQGLKTFPGLFRYDSASLKGELTNPDYEHLWLVLHNASFGNYHWPKLEFRLGAANVTRKNFSDHPKLEIPLIQGEMKPFDSWFEESVDDFGAKYELRFDIKQQILDSVLWSKTKEGDQKMLQAFINVLNKILSELKFSKTIISRDWNDWLRLAEGMVLILVNTQKNKH